MQKEYTREEILKDSLWITIAWEWFQKLLGRAVDSVLWVTMVFAGYQLIPGAPQPPQALSILMFVSQFIALDIGGLGLNQLARQQGLERWAYPRIIAYCLIGITLVTITYSGVRHAVPDLNSQVTSWTEVILVIARSFMTVFYGQAIHALKAEERREQNQIEDLNTELNTKQEELNTLTLQLNTQLNTLQQQLNTKVNEVNTLRVKLNTQAEEISVLGVKLESKETQLAGVKGAHESSLEAIQEAQSRVKTQLAEAHKEAESLRSQMLNAQGALHTEKQRVSTLTSKVKDLNTELNTKQEELNTLTLQLNTQLNTLQQQLNTKVNEVNTLRVKLNTKTDELDTDTHKIVQLDTQTETSKNYELRIRSLLASEPDLPGREISRRIGCSVPTACSWKKQIEKERKEA